MLVGGAFTSRLARDSARAVIAAAALLGACGGSPSGSPPVELLSSAAPQYGKTYDEWAAAWVAWLYQLPEAPTCTDPVADPTGALCTFAQDPTSPVFFLTGDWGTVVHRAQCVVPAGKALLIPLVVTFQDNGGVPMANQKTPEQLKQSSLAQFASITEVSFSLDDHAYTPLDLYAIRAAPYTYTLPSEPNIYDCQGTSGVLGTYSGFTSGYFVLLPPLSVGTHTIHITAQMTMGTTLFNLSVTYDPLTIQ